MRFSTLIFAGLTACAVISPAWAQDTAATISVPATVDANKAHTALPKNGIIAHQKDLAADGSVPSEVMNVPYYPYYTPAEIPTQPKGIDTSKPITRACALEIAFCNNPSIRVSAAQMNRARAVIAEARANFNPSFTANLVETFQGPKVVILDQQVSPSELTASAANVTLPLDISRKLTFTTDIAKMQFQLQYLSLLQLSEQLIFDTQSAYYNVLRAYAQMDVAQANLDLSDRLLSDAQARFDAGVAPKFDVTTAETTRSNAQQLLIQATNAVALAKAALSRVMGVDVNCPIEVVREIPPVSVTSVDIAAQACLANKLRPAIKSAQTAVALTERNVKLQRTGYLPSLAILGDYNYNFKAAGLSTAKESWSVVAALSVPIWDGGVTRARVHEAQYDVAAAKSTLDETLLGVELEVRNAALNLEEAAKRIPVAQQSVSTAEESVRLAQVRYTAGIATPVEVTDAQQRLATTRVSLVNANYDYAVALADLQRATATQPELGGLQLLCPPAIVKR